MSEEEIGALTPRLFFALLKRKQSAERQEYLRSGVIAAAVINFSMGHPDKPVNEFDFIPPWLKEEEQEKEVNLQKLAPEAAAAYLKKQFSKKIYTRRG